MSYFTFILQNSESFVNVRVEFYVKDCFQILNVIIVIKTPLNVNFQITCKYPCIHEL